MFDAYTVRKIAPRLLIAIIGVNLSIYLCIAAVDITNIIGGGIGDLIRQPFRDTGDFTSIGLPANPLNVGAGIAGIVALGSVGVVGGAAAGTAAGAGGAMAAIAGSGFAFLVGGGVAALLMFLLVALVSVGLIALAIAATVIIRYGAILVLTLASPIAIAMLVLPGTEKYFKAWWDIFMKVLIMYPIIAIIFAISDIMAALFLVTLAQQNQLEGLVTIFVIIIVLYAPLFMIPFAYKLAGGLIGAVYDFANKNGIQRANEGIKNWKKDPNSMYGSRTQKRQDTRARRGLTPGQMASGVGGGIRARRAGDTFRGGYTGALGTNKKTYLAAEKAEKENEAVGALGTDDDIWHAVKVLAKGGSRQEAAEQLKKRNAGVRFDSEQGGSEVALQQALGQAQDVINTTDSGVAGAIAIRKMAQTKTAWDSPVEMMDDINSVAGGDRALASRLLGDSMEGQKQAGRLENSNFGYSEGVKQLEVLSQNTGDSVSRQNTEETARQALHDTMLGKTSAGQLATMNERSVSNVAGSLVTDIKTQQNYRAKALADHGPNSDEFKKADVKFQRETAKLANLYDGVQHANPQNAEQLATHVFSQQVQFKGQSVTVQKMIEDMRGRAQEFPEFANMRRDFDRDEMEARRARGDSEGNDPSAGQS